MRRREFIAGLGAAASPLVSRAQQGEGVRHVGFLVHLSANDLFWPAFQLMFERSLQDLGWTVGRNIQIYYRFAAGEPDLFRKHAAELVGLAPDVIMAGSVQSVGPLLKATRTIPIVFVLVGDPVGAGLVDSLSRPGGNVTGFMTFEYGMAAKWLELLRQIAPSVTRVAVLRDTQGSGPAAFGVIQAAAPSLEITPIDTIDPIEIERGITSFAQDSNGGLIATGSNSAAVHRKLIVTLAARYKLPAVYSFRSFVVVGGLISYGIKSVIQFQQAAGYVNRILKGERPAELPVQAPTSFELVVDLNTAKTLGLTIPETLLATADEVIQ